jgi:hypothetical protein
MRDVEMRPIAEIAALFKVSDKTVRRVVWSAPFVDAVSERGGDVADRTEQDERIILGHFKAAPLPELSGLAINRVDQLGPSADQRSGLNASL